MGRFEEYISSAQVRNLKPLRKPIVVSEKATVDEVVGRMAAGRVGCVLVEGDENRIVGIFTERDLLKRVFGAGRGTAEPVTDFMTKNPTSVTLSDSLVKVMRLMDNGHFRHLPVMENGKPVAVISARSLLRHISELYPAVVFNQPPDYRQKYEEADGA